MGYKEDLQISRWELAELWENHTDHYIKWGENLSSAIQERDETKLEAELEKSKAKDELDSLRAHLDLKFRVEFKYFGLSKPPTDKLVVSLIDQSQEFIEAKKKYLSVIEKYGKMLLKAEYNANVMKSAKDAFDHRRSAMENLTKLLVGGFFSAKLPKELKEEVVSKRDAVLDERARASSNESIRRRRVGRLDEKTMPNLPPLI
jgi:hypothetical protein